MSYEYLKGLGWDQLPFTGQEMRVPSPCEVGKSRQICFAEDDPVDKNIASSSGCDRVGYSPFRDPSCRTLAGKTGNVWCCPESAPLRAAAPAPSISSGATVVSRTPQGTLVYAPVVSTPIPSGSNVSTNVAERVTLKGWCSLVFGPTSAFYLGKLKSDPSFTYVDAAVLARYRNASVVVTDLIRQGQDTNISSGDISSFKSWWLKCHKDTWSAFSMSQVYRQNALWVPRRLSEEYKRSYKATGTCPTAITRQNLFEYLRPFSAEELLEEKANQQYQGTAAPTATKTAAAPVMVPDIGASAPSQKLAPLIIAAPGAAPVPVMIPDVRTPAPTQQLAPLVSGVPGKEVETLVVSAPTVTQPLPTTKLVYAPTAPLIPTTAPTLAPKLIYSLTAPLIPSTPTLTPTTVVAPMPSLDAIRATREEAEAARQAAAAEAARLEALRKAAEAEASRLQSLRQAQELENLRRYSEAQAARDKAAQAEAERIKAEQIAAAKAAFLAAQAWSAEAEQKAAEAESARNDADYWKTRSDQANQQVTELENSVSGMQESINALNNQLSSAASPDVVTALQDQIAVLNEQLAAMQAQVPVAESQAEVVENQAVVAESQAAVVESQAATAAATSQQATQVAADTKAATESWYEKNKTMVWIGAAAAAVGLWWYVAKGEREGYKEPAMTANTFLPAPTSPRRPSGLKRNRSRRTRRV